MSNRCPIEDHLGEDFALPKSTSFALLREQLVAHGAEVDKTVPFEVGHENISMKAGTDIQAGDTIVYIPYDCIISGTVAMKAQINQAIQSSMSDSSERKRILKKYGIGLFFMEEIKNPDSFYRHYINI